MWTAIDWQLIGMGVAGVAGGFICEPETFWRKVCIGVGAACGIALLLSGLSGLPIF